MAMLADTVDGVIGVDTHRDTLAAAAVTQVGGVLAQTTTSADAAGDQHLLDFVGSTVPGRRGWVVEGAAASAPAWPCSCSSAGNTSSRSVDPSGQHPAPGPRATRWTPSGPPGKPSARSAWPPRAGRASGRPCGCC
jgi:hypothetical protein